MTKKILSIVGAVVLVISLITGVWLVDDRYVSAGELRKTKQEIFLKLDTAEYQAVTEQYYKFKSLSEHNPNDESLKRQVEKLEKERREVKERIDNALRNNNNGT
jgi:FtsZ-interacting cell division protein ZipA